MKKLVSRLLPDNPYPVELPGSQADGERTNGLKPAGEECCDGLVPFGTRCALRPSAAYWCFLGIAARLLRCPGFPDSQRHFRCGALPMVLPHGLRLFFAGAVWHETAAGRVFGPVWHPICHDLVWGHTGRVGGGLPVDVPHSAGCFEKLLTPPWHLRVKTLGLSNTIFSGASACQPAAKAFWQAPCWPLQGRWGSMAPPACSSAIPPGGLPPFPPPSISFGAPTMRWGRCGGCDQPGHQHRGVAGCKLAGGPAEKGGEKMSLQVDIHKKLGAFTLTWPWRQAWKSRRCWACWAPLAAEKATR